jgi:hypothetical protein
MAARGTYYKMVRRQMEAAVEQGEEMWR